MQYTNLVTTKVKKREFKYMEWMNSEGGKSQSHPGGSRKGRKGGLLNLRVVSVVLLFCITILIVALVWLVALGSPTPENKFVEKGRLQAVFLNGGQVYFGNIQNLNDRYLRVNNIYYLRVNQTVQPEQADAEGEPRQTSNDISLVKLGCELHGPKDEMYINRDQVVFWENLKSDGQVAQAVAEYVKQNPNGQNCEQPSTTTTPTPTTEPEPETE